MPYAPKEGARAGLLLFGSLRQQRVAAIFFRRLCADSFRQESGGRAEFALANVGGSLPIILARRQIKSPKNSILQNQKSRRNPSIDRESQHISNRLAQSGFCEGFDLQHRISNRF